MQTLAIDRISVFATASLRNISNTEQALSVIHAATGYFEEVISGEEEALFGYAGAMQELRLSGAFLDIGGASTEIVTFDGGTPVNFASFPKIIDSLGGVTITITDREINEINNHPKRYGNVYIEKSYEGTEGKQKLNGKQALAYCRIRKIDTDNARADRQKTVLLQVFKKMKGSSTTELLKVVNDLVGYVYTGYSKKELVSLATYALSNGWMNYETQTFSVPTPDHARGGNYLIGPTQLTPCGPSRGVWLWKSDIPQDAYDLQMKIYGKSNIKLAENRCDYCNLL